MCYYLLWCEVFVVRRRSVLLKWSVFWTKAPSHINDTAFKCAMNGYVSCLRKDAYNWMHAQFYFLFIYSRIVGVRIAKFDLNRTFLASLQISFYIFNMMAYQNLDN